MNTIHDNIKRMRKDRGLTQDDVAKQLFVTRQLISKWEQGKSIPDVLMMEKLSEILGVSINELLDDESVKSMTLDEVKKRKQTTKIIWSSIGLSLAAIIIGVGAWIFFFMSDDDPNLSTMDDYFFVTEISEQSLTLSNDELPLELTYDTSMGVPVVFDPYYEEISLADISLGDSVQIEYSEDPFVIHMIQIIDSVIEEELYGVIVTGHDNQYETWLDATREDQGVRYFFETDGYSGWNVERDGSYEMGDNYIRKVYDIFIDIDPLKVENPLHIGLLTSSGVTYTEEVDLTTQRSYTYYGEYAIDEPVLGRFYSIEVTYNIHIRFQYSLESFTVYEYDKNHSLIHESTWDDWLTLYNFNKQDDTLYGYLEVTYLKQGGLLNVYEDTTVEEVFPGNTVELAISDEYGFILTHYFRLG